MTLLDRLTAIVGPAGVQVNRPLAPLTTFHVGGPADFVVEARARRIGTAAQRRIISEHTYAHRAAELDALLTAAARPAGTEAA